MNTQKKSWHLEIAEATKLKPNLIPHDIVFQFKKHQPYRFHRKPESQLRNYDKPPVAHTRVEKEFRVRSETSCRTRPMSQCKVLRDSSANSNRSPTNTSKIEKTSLKLLQEIDSILHKENLRPVFTPTIYTSENNEEVRQDFKHLSRRITKINKGRIPMSNLRVDMYKKPA